MTDKEREAIRHSIVKACTGRFLSAKEIADKIGLPRNTVRAHYIYYMAEKGDLVTLHPLGRKQGQRYSAK